MVLYDNVIQGNDIIKSGKSQICTTMSYTQSLSPHTNTHKHTHTLTYHLQRLLYATGWRVPIGCLKLNFTFRNRATNYRPLLPKTTYKDKASYGSSPPCNYCLNIIYVCMCKNRSRKYQQNP